MPTKICACCGQSFTPRPQVRDQVFCSAPACQRERRLRWQRDKMQSDPDYRDNQSRSQRAWLDRHPDYWRMYRSQSESLVDFDPFPGARDAERNRRKRENQAQNRLGGAEGEVHRFPKESAETRGDAHEWA